MRPRRHRDHDIKKNHSELKRALKDTQNGMTVGQLMAKYGVSQREARWWVREVTQFNFEEAMFKGVNPYF